MDKTLIVGDLHIDSRSIPEIENIFKGDIFPVEAHTLIQLGDYYDSNFPNAEELKFGTALAKKMKKKYKEVIVLSGTGNHDIYQGHSVVEYLQEIGIKVVKGDYFDQTNKIFYGHFMINESNKSFGSGECTLSKFDGLRYVLLGHQHQFQQISSSVFHLGSIRYCSFGEFGERKYFGLLNGQLPLEIKEITHCIPMYEINLSHAKESSYSIFDTLPIQSKVRVVIDSWELYKETADLLNKIGKKFFEFKIKHEYETPKIEVSNKIEHKSNIIDSYLEGIQDKEVQAILKEQFKK